MDLCLGASGKGNGLHLESKIRKESGPAESTVPFKGPSPGTQLPLGPNSLFLSPFLPPLSLLPFFFSVPTPFLFPLYGSLQFLFSATAQAGLELMTLIFLPLPY